MYKDACPLIVKKKGFKTINECHTNLDGIAR